MLRLITKAENFCSISFWYYIIVFENIIEYVRGTMSVKPPDVIRLYRDLLRYGRSLKYTNKQFYYRRIRNEFDKHRNLEDTEEISFFYQKGLQFLKNKRII